MAQGGELMIKIELPLTVIEPLFTALMRIRAMEHSRLETKAVGLLKQALYFELERITQDDLEKAEQEFNFKKLFNEERIRRGEKVKL
jgi:hypothetical protein